MMTITYARELQYPRGPAVHLGEANFLQLLAKWAAKCNSRKNIINILNITSIKSTIASFALAPTTCWRWDIWVLIMRHCMHQGPFNLRCNKRHGHFDLRSRQGPNIGNIDPLCKVPLQHLVRFDGSQPLDVLHHPIKWELTHSCQNQSCCHRCSLDSGHTMDINGFSILQCWQNQLAECFPRTLTSFPSNTEVINISSWWQYGTLFTFRSLLKTCDNQFNLHVTQELQVLLNGKATQNNTWCFQPSNVLAAQLHRNAPACSTSASPIHHRTDHLIQAALGLLPH